MLRYLFIIALFTLVSTVYASEPDSIASPAVTSASTLPAEEPVTEHLSAADRQIEESAAPAEELDTDSAFWEPVANALIYHESKGNPNVVAGPYVGPLQISPQLVNGCNKILRSWGITNRTYTLKDRYSIEKSKEMFLIIMKYYVPERDIDRGIRVWAAGPKFSIRATQRAVNEVREIMRKQAAQ